MIQCALNFNLEIKSMDPDPNAPCKSLASQFVNGDIKDFDQGGRVALSGKVERKTGMRDLLALDAFS